MGSGFCFSVTTACNVNRLRVRYCKSTEHKLIRVSETFPEILPAPPTIALLLSALDMGHFWARCMLGFDLKAQVHHHRDGPGLLGAAIYRAVS